MSDYADDAGFQPADGGDEQQPYDPSEGAYGVPDDSYQVGENPYDNADYDQYGDGGDADGNGYGQEMDEAGYLQNAEYSQQEYDGQEAYEQAGYSQQEAYEQDTGEGMGQEAYEQDTGEGMGQEAYEQAGYSQQEEFNEGQETYEQGDYSQYAQETYEQTEYSQYSQQELASQGTAGEHQGQQPQTAHHSAPSPAVHTPARSAPANQSAHGIQRNTGHPNTPAHQRGASVPSPKPQPGHANVPNFKPAPVRNPSQPLARPAQSNPAQSTRAPPAQQRPAQQRPAQQRPAPRPGAPQTNTLPRPRVLANAQQRPSQPSVQAGLQVQRQGPPNAQSPQTHIQPMAGQGFHPQTRPPAGRPNSPPGPPHTITQTRPLSPPGAPNMPGNSVPSRNPAVGPPKAVLRPQNPVSNVENPAVGAARPVPNLQQPQYALTAPVHHNANSAPNPVSAVLHNLQPPHIQPPHLPLTVGLAIPSPDHKAPSGYSPPHLQPPGPKPQEAGVVHELKITHEHAAPAGYVNGGSHQTQQPIRTPGMVVGSKGGGNRNVKNLPVIAGRGRTWSDGLCSFTDLCGTCCLACWCPCIVYGQNKARLDYLSSHGVGDPKRGGGYCSGDCCIHGTLTTLCGVGWILQISPRKNVRARYNIQGSGLEDCCMSLCCGPCALTQESKELGLEEDSITVRK